MIRIAIALLVLVAFTSVVEAADTTRFVGITCEVFVNRFPLTDDDDQITLKTAVAHNESGMALYWMFETAGGVITATEVTPAASGNYQWAHEALGIYSLTLPAAGGAGVNNDQVGTGWFVGKCDDVLAWRGPNIEFVEPRGLSQ